MTIQELTFRGLLSFGPDTPPFEMRPLNVLIGPNGSGKSNFIEALGLLRSAATKLTAPVRGMGGGGVTEWLWKGAPKGPGHVEAVIAYPTGKQPLRHVIEFTEVRSRFELTDERIENQSPYEGHDDVYFYYRYQDGRPVLSVRDGPKRALQRQDVAPDESILSQVKDPDQYPELTHLTETYPDIRLYRNWTFGRGSVLRTPQASDLPGDRLMEDFSNLGLFLNHLRGVPSAKKRMVQHLRDLYEGLDDFDISVKGGTVEVLLTEGDFTIPGSRLSDGTLRYLCLLAILCDPEPPAVVAIEEPELGLHFDLLPKLADLMREASERTQLIVTTHSDFLADALTERPEAIVVVEKRRGQTTMSRLKPDDLREWLKRYSLGQLWVDGHLGGTRW